MKTEKPNIEVPELFKDNWMESQAFFAGYMTKEREDRDFDETTNKRNNKIEILTKALERCLHVIEKGIEVRMEDKWPTIQKVLPEAKRIALEALNYKG